VNEFLYVSGHGWSRSALAAVAPNATRASRPQNKTCFAPAERRIEIRPRRGTLAAMLKLSTLSSLAGAMILALGGCQTVPVSHEPANLYPLKQEIRAYVDSGQYERDIAVVAAEAQGWLERRAAQRAAGERLAVVFDLDETLLSNWPEISAQDFGYNAAAWDAWVKAGTAPVIAPVREVQRAARRLGLEVIFLTGRRERDRPGTEKNLRDIGYSEYAALIFKPDDAKETTGAFKLAERRRLTAEGRVIIANIGDQDSDLAGGYAERTFRLPDPFYVTQ
jgi:predicted secreted acid phosphatase